MAAGGFHSCRTCFILILSLQLSLGLLLDKLDSCAVCNGTRFMFECTRNHKCPGSKCYLQVLEDETGQLIYGGCASNDECNAVFSAKRASGDHNSHNQDNNFGSNIPLKHRSQRFLCGGCCDDRTRCNMHTCGIPLLGLYTGTPSVTNTGTTTTVPAAVAVQCETCSGPICGIVPGQVSQCPADKPYCMNTVQNSASGQKTITKTCASVSACETKWWRGTYGQGNCANFKVDNVYPFDFTCNFCCVLSNCNKNVLPNEKSLYGINKQPAATFTTMTKKTTTSGVTTTTTPTTTTIRPLNKPAPVHCETCSGPICGIVPAQVSQCPADKPYCMNTVQNSANGQKTITKTCTSVSACEAKWWHVTASDNNCGNLDLRNRYPFDFTCNFCCVLPNCNKDIIPAGNSMYGLYKQTTSTTAMTTEGPLSLVECEVCSGNLCGVVPTQHSVSCPANTPYCMNTIVNHADGSRLIAKQCASASACNAKWIHGSKLEPTCDNFDVKNVYPFDVTCNYCCTTALCNRDILPRAETLYQQH